MLWLRLPTLFAEYCPHCQKPMRFYALLQRSGVMSCWECHCTYYADVVSHSYHYRITGWRKLLRSVLNQAAKVIGISFCAYWFYLLMWLFLGSE